MRSFDPESRNDLLSTHTGIFSPYQDVLDFSNNTLNNYLWCLPMCSGAYLFCVFLNLGFLPVQVHFDTWGAEHDEWIAKDSQALTGKAREFHRLMVDTRI